MFERYIGIDYSGAGTPTSSQSGLRVYAADSSTMPREVVPPTSPRKYWTRRGIAEWLREELSGNHLTIVGIDHAFSFPLAYFERHDLRRDWDAFLDHFHHHCPTDEDNTYVDFIREGIAGKWDKLAGNPSWLRLTEQWTPSAKSVFQFDVQGAVAKSTFAGIPWLRYLRQQNGKVHFWPFDGWDIPESRSAIAEVYPSLWMRRFPLKGATPDQHAAYSIAAWLRRADLNGSLPCFFNPPLEPNERTVAQVEGWILGGI